MPLFDGSVSCEYDHWWDFVRYYVSDPWFVQVYLSAEPRR